MRIRLLGRALEGGPEIRDYIEHRLLSTLGHLSSRVECMAVSGDPIGVGPLKGAFRCHLWARLVRGRQLREEQVEADLYAAIDRVAEALARDVEYIESRRPRREVLRCA